jgi:hypothetical protein
MKILWPSPLPSFGHKDVERVKGVSFIWVVEKMSG